MSQPRKQLKVGRYGSLHLQSLQQNRPDLLKEFEESGQLERHLQSINRDAEAMKKQVLQGLLANHPGLSAGRQAMLERQAEEVVLNDLVLVPEKESEEPEDFTE